MQKRIQEYMDNEKFKVLEDMIGYTFKDINILKQAVTHRSFANENRGRNIRDNERLEFLGDAILDLIISRYLFDKYPIMPEGDLSKIRASIVCEGSLARIARQMNLGQYIFLGKGEEMSGGRERPSILADAFEAVTGALLVDSGYMESQQFLERTLIKSVNHLSSKDLYTDYKTLLQEVIQKESTIPLQYEVLEETGPDHDKDFFVAVYHGQKQLGKGNGKSKKEAEQEAAKKALDALQK